MKNRSWGCSVTRTCLKNTVTDPVSVRERSTSAKPASSKGTSTRQPEAMAIPTIDQSVTNKEDVDALNTLILRKLAKESFINDGGARKVEYSGASQCNKKVASTWGTLHEARSATVSCKCGSHVGKELFSTFPNLHNNTMYMDATKSNSGSFDAGKIPDGVGSLMSRIGLDNRKKTGSELLEFQNPSRFDKVLQPRTLISTQDFLEAIPSKDVGEASDVKSSMHTVGQMWCIPEANSVGDVRCTEFSPYQRCSTMGTHEKAIDLRSNPALPLTAHDELSPLENNFLKPHVNSPVHEENSREEVIEQTSLHNALIKGMQLRMDEAAWDLKKSRSKQHSDSPIAGTELIRKIFKDDVVEEVISSKTPWPEQLKTAAQVRWNLRELMQREEIEDDVDANLNALRTEYMPKHGSRELGCLEEQARSLVRKQNDTKQEDSVGDHGTPRRLELGIAKFKHEEIQICGDCQEDTKTEPNTTPRNQLIAESTIQGVQVQKGRIARRASPRQNHVYSSCDPGDNCRNADAKEEDDEVFQGQASLQDNRKPVIPNDFCDDSAAVRELEVDWGTDRDDLEVLLQFLTMKQHLRENRKTDVEAVVQTEAIVRELLARMKLDIDCSPSVDSDASIFFLPRSHAGEPVVDDGYGEVGRKRREQVRSVDTSDAAVRSVLARLTFEDSVDPQVVVAHLNQNIDSQNRPAIRRPSFVVPSSSKSQCLQRMAGSTSTRKTTSCVRNYVNQSEEYKAATSPSRNSEEARKRSRRSTVGARQPESCRTSQSVVGNAIEIGSEEVKSDGPAGNVVEGGSSTVVTGMETVDRTSGATQVMASTEHDGISNETKFPHGSPTRDAMPLVSARNLESRSFASNFPVTTPWNYQREKQLPIGLNAQLASPNKRSTPRSLSSPEHHRQCRDSPTRKSSPNNRPSPGLSSPNNRPSPRLSSPQRQQKPRPATATSKSTAAQLGSPKRPSPQSSPQRQQRPRPATAISKSTAAQLGSPKRPSPQSSPQRQQRPRPATAISKSTAAQLGSPKRPSPQSSPLRQQKPRSALATLVSTAAHVGSPKRNKTLSKVEENHMTSTTVPSKSGSHDPDMFPAGISEAVVQESIALAKDSCDPYVDFRDSMLEMMQEKNLWQQQEELQDLLQCFLHLNQPVHHQMIHRAFSDVVSFGSPLRYSHKSSKKDRSNAHFSRRSSPSRQLYYEASQPCKSPLRGGG